MKQPKQSKTDGARNLLLLVLGTVFLGNIGLTGFWWPELIGSNLIFSFEISDSLMFTSMFIFFAGLSSFLWFMTLKILFLERTS